MEGCEEKFIQILVRKPEKRRLCGRSKRIMLKQTKNRIILWSSFKWVMMEYVILVGFWEKCYELIGSIKYE
jgi:hypothetical protein